MFITYILHPDIDQTSSADEDQEIVKASKKRVSVPEVFTTTTTETTVSTYGNVCTVCIIICKITY